MTHKWLTNAHVSVIDQVQRDLLMGNDGRIICGGSPKADSDEEEFELIAAGMMGLWDVFPNRSVALPKAL